MEQMPPDGHWEFTGREQVESFLDANSLERRDVCLVGSVSLSARGLREHNDVDICIHSRERNRIQHDEFGDFVGITEGKYEIIEISDDELIENPEFHDVIDGFKVVRPEITFSYKKLRNLPKDQRDVALLEDYSQATDDWDWSLYRSDYSEPPDTLLSRGLQSLRTDGVLVTADKVLGLINRRFPVVRRLNEHVPVYDIRTPVDAVRGSERTVTPAELLTRQFSTESFVSMDVVAYWAAIDALAQGDQPAFAFQKLGVGEDELTAHQTDVQEPISVSQKHRIHDAVACARALHAEPETLAIEATFKRRGPRGEDWLRQQGFNAKEIAHLHERTGALFERFGGLFYAIFWPPATEYFDEMERTLGEKVIIHESEDIEISEIRSFVNAIYDAQAHDAPAWAIDWKAEQMTAFPSRIRLVKIILPTPRFHDGISREMEMIKNDVRHTFVKHFDDEYYLSLIHATDSFADNQATKKVIDQFR